MPVTLVVDDGDAGTLYTLDATTDLSWDLTGSVTSYTVANKRNISDHYQNNNDTFSFTGGISDITAYKTINNTLQPKLYIDGLKAAKESATPIQILVGDNYTLSRYLIESLKLSKDQTTSGDSWNVSISLTKVKTAESAQTVLLQSSDIAVTTKGKTNNPGNTIKPLEEDQRTQVEIIRDLRIKVGESIQF